MNIVSRRRKTAEPALNAEIIQRLKLAQWLAWQPYVRRFAWIHIAVMMSTIFAMSMCASLVSSRLFNQDHRLAEYVMMGALAGALLMSICFILLIRGHARAVWGLFAMLVACLSFTVLELLQSAHRSFPLFVMLIPLTGLYLMSTRRYQRGTRILQVGARKRRRLRALEASLKRSR